MVTIVTRAGKGAELTHAEVDANFTNLNDLKLETSAVGVSVQGYHANLAAFAGLTGVADRLPYFTGAGAMALANFSSVARTLLAQTSQANMRSTGLGLGTAATMAGPTGTIVGTTDAQTLTNKTLTTPTVNGATLSGSHSMNGRWIQNLQVIGASALDLNTGNVFYKAVSGNTTFTLSNVPANLWVMVVTVIIAHTGGTITWWSGVKWPGGTAPTLTTGKTHVFTFMSPDGGTNWYGSALANY